MEEHYKVFTLVLLLSWSAEHLAPLLSIGQLQWSKGAKGYHLPAPRRLQRTLFNLDKRSRIKLFIVWKQVCCGPIIINTSRDFLFIAAIKYIYIQILDTFIVITDWEKEKGENKGRQFPGQWTWSDKWAISGTLIKKYFFYKHRKTTAVLKTQIILRQLCSPP